MSGFVFRVEELIYQARSLPHDPEGLDEKTKKAGEHGVNQEIGVQRTWVSGGNASCPAGDADCATNQMVTGGG
jgi:hypothetical protein